jgi:predicted RNA-binding protein with PUA-like domain
MPLKYYLAKTDPETYSIDHFETEKRTTWDGVKNAQALQTIRAMKKHDKVFIYHSMGEAAIVGLAQVISEPRPDPKAPNDAKLTVVDFEFLRRLEPFVTLREIKESKLFDDWALVRQSRLSTMEAPAAFVTWMKKKFPSERI